MKVWCYGYSPSASRFALGQTPKRQASPENHGRVTRLGLTSLSFSSAHLSLTLFLHAFLPSRYRRHFQEAPHPSSVPNRWLMKRYVKDGCCVSSASFSVLYFDLNNILDGSTFAIERVLGWGLNKSNWNDIFVGILVFSSCYGLLFPLATELRS